MPKPDPDIVVLAGSGRSGTTWLGSILNSYEGAEYFYEITAYPELDFDHPDLMRIKYPLTFWMEAHPLWASRMERWVLKQRIRMRIRPASAQRSLRVHYLHSFRKTRPDVHLFKIVSLFGFATQIDELSARLGKRLKAVHIVRNPYSQLASEIRMDSRNPEKSRQHFRQRMQSILEDGRLEEYHELVAKYLDGDWIEHMAVVWRISNDLLLKDGKLDKHLVVYEDLCRDPYGKSREIFEFLGWPISQQTLDHIQETSSVPESESGMFSIRKNAEESITKWRGQMEPETYETIRDALVGCSFLDLWSEADLSLEHREHGAD